MNSRFTTLFFGLILSLSALAQSRTLDVKLLPQKRAAVIFANQNYQVDQYDLQKTVNDADDMKAALERIGFKVIIVEKDLGRVALDRAIRNLPDALKGYQVALFYYSGHGALYRDENFLIPADVPVLSDNADVKTYGVSLNGVYEALSEAGITVGIVVSDACRNLIVGKGGVVSGMVLPTEGPSGTFTMFATRLGKAARENVRGRNGYFTQELLKRIEIPGLTLDALFKATRQGVKEATATLGEPQIPGSVDELDGDYVLIPGTAPNSLTTVMPKPPAPTPVGPPPGQVAVIGLTNGVLDEFELAQETATILAKEYPNYTFVPYEKGKQPTGITICTVTESTQNDPTNIHQEGMHKFKSKVVLKVNNGTEQISQETLNGGGTDHAEDRARTSSVTQTIELTQKLKFEKR